MVQIAFHPEYDLMSGLDQAHVRAWAKSWAKELDAQIAADLFANGEGARLKQVAYAIDNRTYPVRR